MAVWMMKWPCIPYQGYRLQGHTDRDEHCVSVGRKYASSLSLSLLDKILTCPSLHLGYNWVTLFDLPD